MGRKDSNQTKQKTVKKFCKQIFITKFYRAFSSYFGKRPLAWIEKNMRHIGNFFRSVRQYKKLKNKNTTHVHDLFMWIWKSYIIQM